jgi:hypothetical protein
MIKRLLFIVYILTFNGSIYSQEKIELEAFYGLKKSSNNELKSFPVFFALGGRVYKNKRFSTSLDLIYDRSFPNFVPFFVGIQNSYFEGFRQKNISFNQQLYFGKEKYKYGIHKIVMGLSTTLTYNINPFKGIMLGFDYDNSDLFYLKIGIKNSFYLNRPKKSVKLRRKEEMKCP